MTLVFAFLLQAELIKGLADDDLDVRERATDALRAMGLDAGSVLMKALESPDGEVRARAEGLLEELAVKLPATAVQVWMDVVEGRLVSCLRNASPIPIVVSAMALTDASDDSLIASPLSSLPAGTVLGPGAILRVRLPEFVPVDNHHDGTILRPVCLWDGKRTAGTVGPLRVACRPAFAFILTNADAETVRAILADVFDGDRGAPTFIGDARTNSVVVSGADAETRTLIEEVVKQLEFRAIGPSPEP